MDFSAKEIAGILDGKIEGNPDVKVNRIAKIEEAEEGSLSFLANPAYTPYIYKTKASIVLVNKDFKPEGKILSTMIKVDNAYNALAKLLDLYQKSKPKKEGISSLSFVAPTTKKGENIYIGEFAYIGENCEIGNNVQIYPQSYIGDSVIISEGSIIYPGVKIYENCKIGKNCIIHSGVIIGADGFGFSHQTDNNYMKVAQIGNVVLEDNVEIGANTTIDRATMGSTIIKKGVKLDNLIQIAHNVQIGENTVIAAQAGIAGSTKIGENCMFGGQIGISGHLNIGNNVKMAAQTGVSNDVKSDSILMGSPAFDASKFRKAFVHFRNLENLVKRIEELEMRLKSDNQE